MLEGLVLLIVRIIQGVIMIYFGQFKIKDLSANAEEFNKMGFEPGILWGTMIAALEFIGGIAIILGLFAKVAAALFGIQMIVGTVWKITKTDKGFADYSYDLLLFATSLVLFVFGPGILALFTI
ncbi:MAG: DoxX family protein [Thermodesulfobacteriota bacterium]